MSETELSVRLAKAYEEAQEKLKEKSPSIVVVGETGVGKSTLINAVFGSEVAKVGRGKPETQDFHFYPASTTIPVNLYDSKGFERENREQKSRIKAFLEKKATAAKENIQDGVHCIWYLKCAATSRWEPMDTEYVKNVFKGYPVVIILNKDDSAKSEEIEALERSINSENIPNVTDIIRVAAAPKDPIAPETGCPVHKNEDISINQKRGTWACDAEGCRVRGKLDNSPRGVQKLVEATTERLPEITRSAFITAQAANLSTKQKHAALAVAGFALTAYAVGWIPLPFSDAPVLAGLQVGMAASLAAMFNVASQAVLPVMVGQGAVSALGIAAASSLKLIPVVGTIIGGVIDSTVAIAFTAALGASYIAFFSYVYKQTAHSTVEERSDQVKKLLEAISFTRIIENIVKTLKSIKIPRSKAELQQLILNAANEQEDVIQQELGKIDQ